MSIYHYIILLILLAHTTSYGYEHYRMAASSMNSIKLSEIFQNKDYQGKQFQILESMKNGIKLSLDHCKKQFQWERWNCPDDYFLRQPWKTSMTREAAYAAAITAAGIAYNIAKYCTQGLIPGCECNSKLFKSTYNKVGYIIEGCSDNTDFSTRLTRKLLKSQYKKRNDDITKASIHNHNMGIIAVQRLVKVTCKCHGISGSCSVKLCWKHLPPFQEVATSLKKHYIKAERIEWNSVKRIEWQKIPKRKMVFLVDSPDYCKVNNTTGWMGTSGRICSSTNNHYGMPNENKNCEHLCLSCGHNIKQKFKINKWQCNCNFNWCCNVTCQTCSNVVKEYFCEATEDSL